MIFFREPISVSTLINVRYGGRFYEGGPHSFVDSPQKTIQQRVMKVKLSYISYRKSPLVQVGLEIPCWVSVSVPATLKDKQITEKFKNMVDTFYD